MTYNRHNRSNLFVKYNWIDSKIIPNLQKLIISSLASSQIESLSRFLFETGRDIQNYIRTFGGDRYVSDLLIFPLHVGVRKHILEKEREQDRERGK